MMTRHPLQRGTASALLIEYIDGEGDRSLRRVMPIAIMTDAVRRSRSATYLQARCSTANAVRTFRFDRIESLSDAETGEVFAAPDWLAALKLGEGRPFAWADEAESTSKGEQELSENALASTLPAPIKARRAWRAILLAVGIGYLVGRLRLIHLGLRYFHAHHALWL